LWGPKSLPGYRLEQETGIVKAIIVARTILLAGAIAAVWRGRREMGVRVISVPIVAVTIVHAATFSNHRFTAPIEPFLFLLCAGLLLGPGIVRRGSAPVE